MEEGIAATAGQWPPHEFEPATEKPQSCQTCGRVKPYRWHTNRNEEVVGAGGDQTGVVTVGPTTRCIGENDAIPEAASQTFGPLAPANDNAEDSMEGIVGPNRRRMPSERRSVTHPVSVGGFKIYLTAGMYEDGSFGELFVKGAGKEGSTVQGLLDGYATMFSIAIQYGAELEMLCRKFAHTRFEPMGVTDNPEIPYAFSVLDYIARWVALKFGSPELNAELAKIAEEMRR